MKKRKTTRRKSHKERRLRNRLRRQQAMDRTVEAPEAPEGFMSDPASDPGTYYWEQRLPLIKWVLAVTAAVAAIAALVLK